MILISHSLNFSNIINYKQAKQWIKSNCYFQYLKIDDSKEQDHIGEMLGFILDSRYIEDKH